MIRYDLKCTQGHLFESWFRDSAAFDTLKKAKAVSCIVCGDTNVEKRLMAPRIVVRQKSASQKQNEEISVDTPAPQSSETPISAHSASTVALREEFETKVKALRDHIESTSDYVGKDFAEEARKIHYGESDERAIYGETTPDEAESLKEEGVPCAPIPWMAKRND